MITNSSTFVKRKYNNSAREFLLYLLNNPHPNLPIIVEVSKNYYIMEYVQGETLDIILNKETLSSETAKSYVLQLLDAVEVMHKFRIVHRDIKPENIIVTKDGTLKLIDFDIARKIAEDKKTDTEFLGTAGYAAPEQYGFMQTNERTDIYSIGLVYNYMLTGKSPIDSIPTGQIGKIIKKCTHIDNDRRYQSISLLRRDIKKERFTSYRLFEKLPGFRSKTPLKMLTASYVYFIWLLALVLIYENLTREEYMSIPAAIAILLLFVCYCIPFYTVLFKLKRNAGNKKALSAKIAFLIVYTLLGSVVCFAIFQNLTDAIVVNPIVLSFCIPFFILYSIIESIAIGML